jgi:hypothetical protein
MPVLLAGRKPHHIARPNLLNGSAFALDPAKTRGDDQRLTERVPGGAGAGLEGDVGAADARRFRRLISVFTA